MRDGTKTERPSGIEVNIELHDRVAIAARRRGTNLKGAYDQALRAWLGEHDEERDRQMAEFVRFRRMLTDSRDDPNGIAASVLNILREKYGEFSTPTQARAKGKK